jgi:hypothetical protein
MTIAPNPCMKRSHTIPLGICRLLFGHQPKWGNSKTLQIVGQKEHNKDNLRATSHTRLRAPLQALSLVEKAEPVQVRCTLRSRDQRSMWMQDDECKVYMASNGSCFMVIWTNFKHHLLKVGMTQNRDTMALWTFTTIGLFYFNMFEDPHEWKFIEKAFGWGRGHIWLHTTLEGFWPHYMILEVTWDGFRTLSFGLSQLHGHGSWLVCEVALNDGKIMK